MIDIRALRDDPDAVKAALARRGVEAAEVDAVMEADVARTGPRWRAPRTMRAEVKELSRQVGQAKKAGDEARAAELSARSRQLGEDERAAAAEAEALLEQRAHRAALPPQHPGGGRAGRGGRGGQRGSPPVVARAGRRAAGARKGRAPGGARTGRSASRCRSSTWSAGRGWPAPCSPSTGARGRGCCGR